MTDNKLTVIDGETLVDLRLPPTRFCVQTLLPQGVTVLGGAPKIGKSWLVLDLCIRIAKGEPVWSLPTVQGATLYLCLEDTQRRIQERLLTITDDVPANAFFAVASKTLTDGLAEQIRDFATEHPDTVLVVIDTFQMVRSGESDISYASDYQEILRLKQLSTELNISILLVHHLRKQGDSDPLNKLSGTTGISGAVDAVFVLDKSKRAHAGATLICTGRDIPYRELELKFDGEHCVWELVTDSMDELELLLPKEMAALIAFMGETVSFSGTNTEFVDAFNAHTGCAANAKGLKQMMNKWRYALEERGVYYQSTRSNGKRYLKIDYGVPTEAQLSGFGGERTSDGTDELSSLRGSERV